MYLIDGVIYLLFLGDKRGDAISSNNCGICKYIENSKECESNNDVR